MPQPHWGWFSEVQVGCRVQGEGVGFSFLYSFVLQLCTVLLGFATDLRESPFMRNGSPRLGSRVLSVGFGFHKTKQNPVQSL